jgi:hypothetical protein
MAFHIAWKLDKAEGLNADSLLGKISLSDGTHSMVEDSIYVDSWIEALTEASCLATQGATTFDIDIVEESRPFHVRRDEIGGIHLLFGQGEVIADSMESFTGAVRSAAGDFMKRVTSIEGSSRNPTLDQIRSFVGASGGPK